tara:strand:+ start:19 stop:858 length:840 start_codon:yes stop_codon:yes gene_type:complete
MKQLIITIAAGDWSYGGIDTTGDWSNDILLFLLAHLVFIFLIYLSYSMIKTNIKDGWTSGHKSGSTVHTIKKSESPIYFYFSVFNTHVLLLILTSFLLIMTYGLISTDIFRSVKRNDIERVKNYLNEEKDINVLRDPSGEFLSNNLLHCAIEYSQVEVAELLIENKINLNIQNEDGRTPLSLAFRNSENKIVKLLIVNGVDINALDYDGGNALHAAIGYYRGEDQLELIKLLLIKGINPNAIIEGGRAPLDWCTNDSQETQILRKYGAKTSKELKAEGK